MIRTSTTACLRLVAPVVALLVAASTARAQTLPTLTAPVNDFANVIDADSEREMDRRIRALEATTRDAVVVVTVDTFAPYGSIEEFAVRLYEKAGIGQKGKDNGVLFVVAVKDRRARIEVGYDLEQFITDGFAGETIRREMLPAFRDGRYGPGLLAGVTRVIQRVADRRGVTLADVPRPPQRHPSAAMPSVGILIAIAIAILVISRIARRRRGPPGFRGPWGAGWSGWHGGIGGFGGGIGGFGGGFGGGGGGFGGFGGGRSGGGGASGGW
jgi:uncharacterized protein